MQTKLTTYFFIILITLTATSVLGQRKTEIDTTLLQNSFVVKKHSPTKAAIYSAVLPGLGQVYNKKYWKVPIVYGTLGTLGYLAYDSNDKYKKYLNGYIAKSDSTSNRITDLPFDKETLKYYKDRYKRNRDLFYILMGLAYVLNIVDASVDAHFFDFDVSEDLSIQLDPTVLTTTPINGVQEQATLGIRCRINF